MDRAVWERSPSMGRRCPLAVALVAILLSAGCWSHRRFPAPNTPHPSILVPAEPAPRPSGIVQAAAGRRPPGTSLASAGGGLYGASSAGVLKGWTAAGDRLPFDVVTGVSTGALIATLAFLGPEYDDELQQQYTTTRPSDIYRRRWLAELLWSDS